MANQLQHHKVIQDILEKEGFNEPITYDVYKNYVSNAYSSFGLSSLSINVYSTRLLQWFSFCGLAYFTEQSEIIFSKSGNVEHKGKIIRLPKGIVSRRKSFFLCSSGINQSIDLIHHILRNKKVDKNWIMKNNLRNAALDSINLGILVWRNKNLYLSNDYANIDSTSSKKSIIKVIKKEAINSPFLKMLKSELQTSKSMSEIADAISLSFGKKWSHTSKKRYITAGMTWLKRLEDPKLEWFE